MYSKNKGFSLIELVIVVAIIGILAAVGFPSYQESVTKSRRTDAKSALLGFAQAMERHFTENNSYEGAGSVGNPPNTGAPTIFPSEAPIDGTNKYYDLTIETASATEYTLRASPKNGQDNDGWLEIDHTGSSAGNSQAAVGIYETCKSSSFYRNSLGMENTMFSSRPTSSAGNAPPHCLN